MKMINPTQGSELAAYINKLFGTDIQLWGDSLTNNLAIQIQANLDSREVEEKAYGGKKSSYIRDQFLAGVDTSKAQIFFLGRNNVGDTDIVIDDLRTMINYLGHNRFIVLSVPNGGYSHEFNNGSAYSKFTDLEEKLQAAYPNNFLGARKAIIQGWSMGGVRLNSSFVQPAIGANVQIDVTDTAFLSTVNASDAAEFPEWDNQIRVGNMYNADLYTIVSVDSSNLMTVTLTDANVVTEGGTVWNIIYEPDLDVGYLNVVQEMDWQMYNHDTTPSTYRGDSIHPASQEFAGKLIAKFLNARFI